MVDAEIEDHVPALLRELRFARKRIADLENELGNEVRVSRRLRARLDRIAGYASDVSRDCRGEFDDDGLR